MLQGDGTELGVAHQLSEDLFVAVHALDHQALESLLENVAEIVLGVNLGSLFEGFILHRLFLDLIEEELIGLGEIRAETFVEEVNQF